LGWGKNPTPLEDRASIRDVIALPSRGRKETWRGRPRGRLKINSCGGRDLYNPHIRTLKRGWAALERFSGDMQGEGKFKGHRLGTWDRGKKKFVPKGGLDLESLLSALDGTEK